MSERIPAGGPFRASTGMHDSLNLEHLSEAKGLLYTYCPGDFCEEYLARVRKTALLVAKSRLYDLSYDENYAGIDRDVLSLYNKLVELYADYLSGLLVNYGEDIVVRVLHPFSLDGIIVEPGETLPLSLGRGIGLILAGLAEPVRETAIKLPSND
ncbi:MAG: hypothetical protein F7C82_01425 [Desulfurococcales archaeon]|nr:hypothetical protein [Desulfurococcales archaeon]MCE4622845.1 hypothetical protein [Desulfurococcales archaeon]MCE4627028.1 hypothetical protein [Desulfurococcales archaeon]MCE4628921.1 hypothetical protein [Desulfurococcales archaeon]